MNADGKIAEVEHVIAYTFVNKLLCAEAIQMAAPVSVLSINGQLHRVHANKRLAILGDAVATQMLCKAWFNDRDHNGNYQTPAAWTQIVQGRLSNEALARLGNVLSLSAAIIAASGHEGTPGTVMMATAVEALLGAVYEDGGQAAVVRVMRHVGLA